MHSQMYILGATYIDTWASIPTLDIAVLSFDDTSTVSDHPFKPPLAYGGIEGFIIIIIIIITRFQSAD
jgi:hypothetical protein